MDGLPGSEGMARAVLDAHGSGFYALTNHGIFRSDDGWTWDLCLLSWLDEYRREAPSGLVVVG